jgi:MFS family permease
MALIFSMAIILFEDIYHWSISFSGLVYIGVGVGCAIGLLTFASLSDRLLPANDGRYFAERRLILMMYVSPLMPFGLFIYGCTASYKVYWIAPLIGTAITALGAVIIMPSPSIYVIIVNLYDRHRWTSGSGICSWRHHAAVKHVKGGRLFPLPPHLSTTF